MVDKTLNKTQSITTQMWLMIRERGDLDTVESQVET